MMLKEGRRRAAEAILIDNKCSFGTKLKTTRAFDSHNLWEETKAEIYQSEMTEGRKVVKMDI